MRLARARQTTGGKLEPAPGKERPSVPEARRETQAEIAAARDFAEAVIRTVTSPLLILDQDLRVRSANAAFMKRFEVREADTVGQLVYELGNGQWNIPALRLLLEEILPQRTEIEGFEVEHDFPEIGPRFMLLNARRLVQHAGEPGMILLAIDDITDRRQFERHREMLIGELSHRVKNTLAVIQAIAIRTLRQSDSLDEFGDAFTGRLQALGGAHDMIFEGGFERIELERIVERAMRPFESRGEISIAEGPQFAFDPAASQSLILILHELATNAVKHGALSAANGRVSIGWENEGKGDGRRLLLNWVESGGPAVEKPAREGQGMRFAAGARPMSCAARPSSSSRRTACGPRSTFRCPRLAGRLLMPNSDVTGSSGLRILVVEDEFLVADHIAMSLEDMGHVVIGPVATVAEALALVAGRPLDGVLLDANLDGESSAPVAAELAARGVPFLVVTGYGRLDLPTALLNDAPRVAKPYNMAELDRTMASVFAR